MSLAVAISLSTVARGVGIAILVIGYPILAHFCSTSAFVAAMPGVSAAVSLAPTLAFLLWLLFRSGHHLRALLICLALGALLWLFWPFLERNFNWIYFIQHAGSNAMLGYFFGQTLAKGAKPLVTRMAETVRGTLSPAMLRYTRQVTVAWTVFFAGITLVSGLLFMFAPLEAWSIFANLLSLPLLALMFGVEYLVRLKRLPHDKHNLLDSLRAYRSTAASAESLPGGH